MIDHYENCGVCHGVAPMGGCSKDNCPHRAITFQVDQTESFHPKTRCLCTWALLESCSVCNPAGNSLFQGIDKLTPRKESKAMQLLDTQDVACEKDEDYTRWAPGCPDMVLVVVDQGRLRLLDYCGRRNEHEADHGELKLLVETDCSGLSDGVWIVEGHPDYSEDYFGEVDLGWFQVGEPRRLTDEEWELFCDEDTVWPPEWYAEEPTNLCCTAHRPNEATCDDDERWRFFVERSDCEK